MLNIDQLIAEADDVVEQRTRTKTAAPAPFTTSDEEITKLASAITLDETPAQPLTAAEETPFEKAAHALAIVETLLSLEQLQKVATFEKTAKEKGFTEEQIAEFIEKQGMQPANKLALIASLQTVYEPAPQP